MKLKTIYIVAGVLTLMTAASCTKNYLKINTSPTAVTAQYYDPNKLLTTVQLMYTGSGDFGAENWQTEWGGISGYIQHCASTNTAYYYGDKYLYSPGNTEVYFTHAYIYQVQPLMELLQLTANKPQYHNLHLMAQMMKALVFERLTDMYGDVPYFQAGEGYYDRIYTPVYDKQQDIYNDMIKEVSQSVDSLSETADFPVGDVFYQGSSQIDQWKKFGNSLLLRLAMRLTKVDPATAQKYVLKVAGATMQSNADNAIVEHSPGVGQNRDTWSIIGEDRQDLKWCSTYIDTMKNKNDPRLAIMAELISGAKVFPAYPPPGKSKTDSNPADQVGLPPGYIQGGLNIAFDITRNPNTATYWAEYGLEGYSEPSDIVLSYSAPNFIITYAETELLLADAELRWGLVTSDGINAATHYANAVRAAEEQLSAYGATLDATGIDNYVTDRVNDYNSPKYNTDTLIKRVNTQYWLCTVFDEYEAWANWRRTSGATGSVNGFPAFKPTNYTISNAFAGSIPRRLNYPVGQKITNGPNYAAAVARLKGGDQQTSRVWWDVAPSN